MVHLIHGDTQVSLAQDLIRAQQGHMAVLTAHTQEIAWYVMYLNCVHSLVFAFSFEDGLIFGLIVVRGFVYLFAFRVMYVVFLFQPLQRAQPFTSLGWALIYGVIYTRCITVNSVLTTSLSCFKVLTITLGECKAHCCS